MNVEECAEKYAEMMCDNLTPSDYTGDGPTRSEYFDGYKSDFIKVTKFILEFYNIVEK